MRQSILFTKTRREAPKDEISKNATLLIRAGFIHKEMAGVYTYLPLGLRVLKKIEGIIREEMNTIGGQEIVMTTLQDPAVWKKSGRWDDEAVDNWFKTKLANGTELGIASTHEEPLTELLKQHVHSHKDLPQYIYQFQTKFRNELRTKSGIMRTREFIMKDLYSFSESEEAFKIFYETCAEAYLKIFERVGIGEVTYRTVAAGGSFTTGFTDEFQTLSSAGEDIIYIDKETKFAVNKEVFNDEMLKELGVDKAKLVEEKSIEVGNIFPLGTKYSRALGLSVLDEEGKRHAVVMGSYGIGLGRLMGAVVEVLSDEKGMVWPESIAPFTLHLLELSTDDTAVKKYAGDLYSKLSRLGVSVLYDDRPLRAGEKFADADLIGIPKRVVISEKTLQQKSIEIVKRESGTSKMIGEGEFLKEMEKYVAKD